MDYRQAHRAWLRAKLDERGRGARAKLAAHLGVPPSVVTRMISSEPGKEDRDIKSFELARIAEFFGEWPPIGNRAAQPISLANHRAARSAQRMVPEVDVRLAGGAGGVEPFSHEQVPAGPVTVSRDTVRTEWGIPTEFLRHELHVEPGRAWMTEIYGDSMYDPAHPGAPGSLFPGDRVIVDTGDLRPSPPGPFALWDGTGLVVKMVEVIPGTDPVRLRLSSRNPSYGAYEVTEDEARIIGRVRGRFSAL